jgi:prepilin-type N-terminal cleavage/methylation domain-containing protein
MLDERGFTLVEIIAVLIILGILAAVAIPKFIDLTENTKLRVVGHALMEINARERLTFAKDVLAPEGYTGNEDFELGGAFSDPEVGEGATKLTYVYYGDEYTFKLTNEKAVKDGNGYVIKRWGLDVKGKKPKKPKK